MFFPSLPLLPSPHFPFYTNVFFPSLHFMFRCQNRSLDQLLLLLPPLLRLLVCSPCHLSVFHLAFANCLESDQSASYSICHLHFFVIFVSKTCLVQFISQSSVLSFLLRRECREGLISCSLLFHLILFYYSLIDWNTVARPWWKPHNSILINQWRGISQSFIKRLA